MSHHSLALSRTRSGPTRRMLRFAWRAWLALELALQVRRERRLLAALDDRALKDIGFSRGDAYAESSRSFWDVPPDRLRLG